MGLLLDCEVQLLTYVLDASLTGDSLLPILRTYLA